MPLAEVSFICPKCGTRAVNIYLDDDYDEYRQDWRKLQAGTLECGNCENGVPVTKDPIDRARAEELRRDK